MARRYATSRAARGGSYAPAVKHRVLTAAIVLAALVTLAGHASALTDEDACDLVSEDAITDYFSTATETTPDGEEGVYTTCTWNITFATETGTTSAIAFVGIDKVSKVAKQDFKANSKSRDAEKVDGIKKGFYLAEGNAGTITFIKSGNFVNVQFLGSSPEDLDANKDGLTSMAQDLHRAL